MRAFNDPLNAPGNLAETMLSRSESIFITHFAKILLYFSIEKIYIYIKFLSLSVAKFLEYPFSLRDIKILI